MLTVTLDGTDISMDPETDFHIDENNLEGELCSEGRLLSFYGQLAADLKAQAVTFKSRLEVRDSQESIGIRLEGNKITEGGIKERVVTSEDRREYLTKLINAERDFQKIENLFRSQQKKADCLIALTYKVRTELAKSAY